MQITWSQPTLDLIDRAIVEDLSASFDLTAALVSNGGGRVSTNLVARDAGVACGLRLAPQIVRKFADKLQTPLEFESSGVLDDGSCVVAKSRLGTLSGPLHAVLTTERTLLNFLCRMSGVATLTRRFVDVAKSANPNVNIYDTRKTIPGWRELDKYAVRCGGGCNHRFGLYDAVLLKDNHIAGIPPSELRGAIADMLAKIATKPKFVEVEVDSLEQLQPVLGIDAVQVILLDNFALADMHKAVEMRDGAGLRGQVELEASGGVTLETVAAIAATGVDRISVGAITHSAPALDIGLDL